MKGVLGRASKKNVDFHKLLVNLGLPRFVLVDIELIQSIETNYYYVIVKLECLKNLSLQVLNCCFLNILCLRREC